ncbi:PaREP1 family protein [Vulcanisaeta sp. JCM 14467]
MQDLMELINEIARRKGLDPRGRVDLYLRIREELLNEADREYAVNNLVLASEKYWGAVAALLNVIGELGVGSTIVIGITP